MWQLESQLGTYLLCVFLKASLNYESGKRKYGTARHAEMKIIPYFLCQSREILFEALQTHFISYALSGMETIFYFLRPV